MNFTIIGATSCLLIGEYTPDVSIALTDYASTDERIAIGTTMIGHKLNVVIREGETLDESAKNLAETAAGKYCA